MKKNLTVIFILLAFFISCKDDSKKIEQDYLTKAIEQIEVAPHHQWVIVLPGLGCHGCIQETEYFMKTHVDDNRILFILTNTSSIKILEQKTEIKIREQANIYIDRENLFQLPTENTIYPCVIEIKEGKIINHAFQSPQTSALYDLAKKLE